ncbi:hypothetical protein AB0F11_22055 [Streptomyces sp. NPDC032472]|uniref:hypothetical protein n=1 Tax=Streptomyces sp. NPDC032472 TaxID=3155018 RepID=UPI0033BFDD74
MSDQRNMTGKLHRKPVVLASAVALLAVLAGGAWWASAWLGHADRTAETQYWARTGAVPGGSPKPAPEAASADGLMGRLLPLPERYRPGPDLGPEGNDFVVFGERATQTFKDGRMGLSAAERDERDKALAGVKFKGVAGRSYALAAGPGFGGVAAEIHLAQADPQASAPFTAFSRRLLELTGDDPQGPKIDGFPQAKCRLHAEGEAGRDKINSVDCVAVEGDVLVHFRMYGSKDFSASQAASLFKQQLNHLKSSGESV